MGLCFGEKPLHDPMLISRMQGAEGLFPYLVVVQKLKGLARIFAPEHIYLL
jgi:hypothetical protein